jgi:CRISPR-associated protein Csm3
MKIVKLLGKVEVLTGLHIGGGDDVMKIGGIDNPIVKDTNTKNPYIPGSSLKGKIRSLLEWHIGVVGIGNGKPFGSNLLDNVLFQDQDKKEKAINLIKLFGDSAGNKESYGITRISVGDCPLSECSKKMQLTESKYENVIDRKSGTASNPRQTERVPAGVKFDFDIRIKILEGDDQDKLVSMLEKGIELLESDYLGGSGSRGYGRVKFTFES